MASAANSGNEQPPIRTQTLTPTISVEYHNDNQIFLLHRKPDGSVQREQTSAMIVDAMYDMKKRSAMSSLSDISGITGTAQAGPIKEEDEVDYSALEWGDMDPNYRRELEQRPDVKAALHKFRHRHKIARLTPTGDFQEMVTTTIPAPNNPPAVDEGLKEQPITGSVLDTALSSYHEQHIQPSFNMLADSITALSNRKAPAVLRALNLQQMQLSNLEGEICHRTVLLHNVPPFTNYSSIQYNMRYLCSAAGMEFGEAVQSCSTHIVSSREALLRVVFLQQQGSKQFLTSFRRSARYWRDNYDRSNDRKLRVERDVPFSTRLERQPYFALLDMLSDATPPLYDSTSFRTDINALQIWSPEGSPEKLLAQVLYLPFRGEFRCILLVQQSLLSTLQDYFGRNFNDRMMNTLILLQAITNASAHCTTLARFHHSSSFDYSNVSPAEAFQMFPYIIEHHTLDDALADRLGADPGFIHKGFGGLSQVVNAAQFQRGIDPTDYGKGSQGSRRDDRVKGSPKKGKGKGKMNNRDHQQTRHQQYRNSEEDDIEEPPSRRSDYPFEEFDRRHDRYREDETRHNRPHHARGGWNSHRDIRDMRRDVRDRSPSRTSHHYEHTDRYHRGR